MVKIRVNNNRCELIGIGIPTLKKLIEHPIMCIRVPGAFYSKAKSKGFWDGKFRFIHNNGTFDTGKLQQVIEILEGMNIQVKLIDERKLIKPKYVVRRLKEYKLFKHQMEAQLALLNNKVGGLYFPRGFIKAATNAGKTLIAASIHRAYSRKTIFLINSIELLNEAKIELPKYLGNDVGYIASGDIKWASFMVVMIKTATNRMHSIADKLKTYDVCIVDEADLATSATYMKILSMLFHCPVRVGMSGTQFTKLAKDKVKREKIRALFGDNIYEITNQSLIQEGHSSPIEVTITDGNLEYITPQKDWQDEYQQGITYNKARHQRILDRLILAIKEKRAPVLIFAQYHNHIEELYKYLKIHLPNQTMDWVHHKKEDRNLIIAKFREGKINVLVGSLILKRGKNFPLIKTVINAGGGDSITNVLQGPIGRAVRKHQSKDKTIIEDFKDLGRYLKKHSNHRRIAYKNEGFKVKEIYS